MPSVYRVFDCPKCQTQYVDPLRSDSGVYDRIYRHPELMPGYDRYFIFAKKAQKAPDPLGFLAGSMEPYWAVREAVRNVPLRAKVLDIGSGLGYLTFALVSAGFDATGLDLSKKAVTSATQRFGPHYVAGDVFQWSREHAGRYDVVTVLEVIEHVEDPSAWLTAAFTLVKPGGKLIVTTPNREYYVDGSVWATEAPPVHLWWFSAESFRHMIGYPARQLEFVDFSTCEFKPAQPYSDRPVTMYRRPMLDALGRPSSRLRRLSAGLGILPIAKLVWVWLYGPRDRGLCHPDPATRETLAIVITK